MASAEVWPLYFTCNRLDHGPAVLPASPQLSLLEQSSEYTYILHPAPKEGSIPLRLYGKMTRPLAYRLSGQLPLSPQWDVWEHLHVFHDV